MAGHLPQKSGLAIKKVIDHIVNETKRKEPRADRFRSLGIQLALVTDRAIINDSRAKAAADEQG